MKTLLNKYFSLPRYITDPITVLLSASVSLLLLPALNFIINSLETGVFDRSAFVALLFSGITSLGVTFFRLLKAKIEELEKK